MRAELSPGQGRSAAGAGSALGVCPQGLLHVVLRTPQSLHQDLTLVPSRGVSNPRQGRGRGQGAHAASLLRCVRVRTWLWACPKQDTELTGAHGHPTLQKGPSGQVQALETCKDVAPLGE